MLATLSLWLPILLSAAAVFILSSIVHMFMPWHKSDYRSVPNEDDVMDRMRSFAIPPGDYMMPRPASAEQMKSPEYLEKRKRGPVAILTILPSGIPSMLPSLAQWFLYSLVISLFSAYVAVHALHAGVSSCSIYRFVGIPALMGYTCSVSQMSIWYGRKWSTTFKTMFDGLLYALLTAAIFAWLWP